MLADADDTAKAVLTLNLLGRNTSPEQMISAFKSEDGHILTYPDERNASFSANCNALIAMLRAPEVSKHIQLIESLTEYLCQSWSSGRLKDKWVKLTNFILHSSMLTNNRTPHLIIQ